VLFCPIENQVVNIFTKSFTEVKFFKLRSMLGDYDVVTKGGYVPMHHSLSYCVTFVNSSTTSQVVL